METAKVDIRKLQLLCDRINQTIEALNQVRLSVHGLTHSNVNPLVGAIPGAGVPSFGFGVPPTFGLGSIGASVSPFGLGQTASPWMPGFGVPTGIGHTSDVTDLTALGRGIDPLFTARLAQTFPYCFSVVPPTVGI
jgi:hypothetical protein